MFSIRNTLYVVCAALVLSACESLNPFNWFGDEGQESPYAGQEAPGSDQDYPSVASFPERPAEGLIADTRDRLYEEDEKQQDQGKEDTAPEEASLMPSEMPLSSPGEPTPAPVQSVTVDTMSPPPVPPATPPLDTDDPSQPMSPDPVAVPDAIMADETMADETVADATMIDETVADETVSVEATVPVPGPDRNFVSMKMGTVFFPFGSSYISPDDRRHIKKVVDLAKQKNAFLRVVGYASSFTKNMPLLDHQIANFSVSLGRAQAIADLVIANGFDPDRLFVRALSDSRPLFLEVMPAGQQGNQRAEIHMEY